MRVTPPAFHTSTTSAKPRTSRRRSPRLEVNGEIQIRFVTGDEAITLHDVSFEGFSLWSPTARAVGQRRIFLLQIPGQPERVMTAVAMHVRPPRSENDPGHFSGWHVTTKGSQQALNAAVAKLTGRLSFTAA